MFRLWFWFLLLLLLSAEQRRLIDTRTFTRPRKLRESPLRPAYALKPVEIVAESNLNSTFSRRLDSTVRIDGDNGCDILNATVVLDETHHPLSQVELNATFQIENGSLEESPSPTMSDNNNVYPLNTTFPSQMANQTKCVLNATFLSEMVAAVTPPETDVDCEMDGLILEEEEEVVFRKPLLPGAVPKRGLIRTSTLNNDAPTTPNRDCASSPSRRFGFKDVEQNKIASVREESTSPMNIHNKNYYYFQI